MATRPSSDGSSRGKSSQGSSSPAAGTLATDPPKGKKKTRRPATTAEDGKPAGKPNANGTQPPAGRKTDAVKRPEVPEKKRKKSPESAQAESKGAKQSKNHLRRVENEAAQPDSEESISADGERRTIWQMLDVRRMSAMGVSMVVHVVAIVVLGLLTLQLPLESDAPSIVAGPLDKEDTQMEEVVEMEVEETAELSTNVQASMPAMKVDLSGGSTQLQDVAMSDIGVGGLGLGDLSGSDLMQEIGDAAGTTTFFGIKSTGSKFIYVVDNSKSMNGGRFENACAEVLRSVERLGPRQSFYVVFFSDKAYPLFYPKPASNLVPATTENKELLKQWMATIPLVLKTEAKQAIFGALAMNPDAIYILTDGRFTDKAEQDLMLLQGNTIPIHTVGFDSKAGEPTLKMISAKHNGTYRFVTKDGKQETPNKKK